MAKVSKVSSKEVAVLTTNDVPTMLEQVTAQIEALTGKMPNSEKISKNLPDYGNIYEITDIQQITRATGAVAIREQSYNLGVAKTIEMARSVGMGKDMSDAEIQKALRIPAYTLEGVGAEKWFEELFKCTQVVSNKTQLDKLNAVRKELEDRLSDEDKLAKTLQRCADIMNS